MCGLKKRERLLEANLNENVLGGFSDYGNLPSGPSWFVWIQGGARTFLIFALPVWVPFGFLCLD